MPLDNFYCSSLVDRIDIQQTTVEPVLRDRGNREGQGRTVSKTIQLGLFTDNSTVFKAGFSFFRKASFPFATVSFPANRKVFRLEVGDLFLFSFSKYNINQRVYRVESIEEDNPESEKITITATEEIFSRTNKANLNKTIANRTILAPDYSLDPFSYVKVVEVPYVMSPSTIKILPLASKQNALDLGFALHISDDGGSSYTFIKNISSNIVPYGTLVSNYSDDTYTIDMDGFVVEMISGKDSIESTTFSNALKGTKWSALLGNEIISFQDFIPISETQYQVSPVFRGRFGTKKESHLQGEEIWIIPSTVSIITNTSIITGANLLFKLVPYNAKQTGEISDASAFPLSIIGRSFTPYTPVNFEANGNTFRYTEDIVLTWSARKKGEGSGIGLPGSILPINDYEGYFKIEIWVNDVLKRTVRNIDNTQWTYLKSTNLADNGSLPTNITFKLSNYTGNVTQTGFKIEEIIPIGDNPPYSMNIDLINEYIYIGQNQKSKITRRKLSNFNDVTELALPPYTIPRGTSFIDIPNDFIYFASGSIGRNITKVRLSDFSFIETLAGPEQPYSYKYASKSAIDQINGYAYITWENVIHKLNLASFTFDASLDIGTTLGAVQVDQVIELLLDETSGFLYAVAQSSSFNSSIYRVRVVKISLSTFTIIEDKVLNAMYTAFSALIDNSNIYIFGLSKTKGFKLDNNTGFSLAEQMLKIDLATFTESSEYIGINMPPYEYGSMDIALSDGNYFYVTTVSADSSYSISKIHPETGQVDQIKLVNFEGRRRAGFYPQNGVVDTINSKIYYGTAWPYMPYPDPETFCIKIDLLNGTSSSTNVFESDKVSISCLKV